MGTHVRCFVAAIALFFFSVSAGAAATVTLPGTYWGFVDLSGPAQISAYFDVASHEAPNSSHYIVGWAAEVGFLTIDGANNTELVGSLTGHEIFKLFGQTYSPPLTYSPNLPLNFSIGEDVVGLFIYSLVFPVHSTIPNIILDITYRAEASPLGTVPLPGALPMFAAGLGLFVYLARKRKRQERKQAA